MRVRIVFLAATIAIFILCFVVEIDRLEKERDQWKATAEAAIARVEQVEEHLNEFCLKGATE